MLFPLYLRANEKNVILIPAFPSSSKKQVLNWGSFCRLQLEVMTTQDYEGYILLPCGLPPLEEARISPQTLKNGEGVERCLEGCRTSGLAPSQRTPQTGHCLKVLSPGTCQEAIKDQPRRDHIPEQTLATFQEYRADL